MRAPWQSPGDALVTGVGSGIGAAIARHLLASGWRVFGSVRREVDAEELAGANLGGRFVPLIFDVRDCAALEAGCSVIARDAGGLDLLVNNAGCVRSGPVEFLSAGDVDAVIGANLSGVVHVTRVMLPLLRKRRGRVLSIGSVSGRIGYPFLAIYAASKFGLRGFHDALRRELRSVGVSVVLLEVGPVRTPIWEKAEEALSVESAGVYSGALERFRLLGREAASGALGVGAVLDALDRVLESRSPRGRYRVVSNPWTHRFCEWLPGSVIDAVVARTINS